MVEPHNWFDRLAYTTLIIGTLVICLPVIYALILTSRFRFVSGHVPTSICTLGFAGHLAEPPKATPHVVFHG